MSDNTPFEKPEPAPDAGTSHAAADGQSAPRDIQFAGWWRPMTRREFDKGALAFGALALLAGVGVGAGCEKEKEEAFDSLKLQRDNGWNVGAESSILIMQNRTFLDSLRSANYIRYKDPILLNSVYNPQSPTWRAYVVPTLGQSLSQSSLRSLVGPVSTPSMQTAHDKGESVGRDLLAATENARTTMLIVDLPGPDAVAFGAGIAAQAHVVPTFDNWPHPSGVVPAHQTLGAMLYYAGEMAQKKAQTPPTAPAAFLLDANRLAPYADAASRFDNRYPAKLPEVADLQRLGIKSVLYVVPGRTVTREQDDLNDLFVAYQKAGIRVGLFPLDDLRPAPGVARTPGQPVVYYYGGRPETHFYFFTHYPFFVYRPALVVRTRVAFAGAVVAPIFARPVYAPIFRRTVFTGLRVGGVRGIGRVRPVGFGRTSVRVAGGRVRAVRVGRSGSFTRAGFGRFG
jgi:hypothetical protein